MSLQYTVDGKELSVITDVVVTRAISAINVKNFHGSLTTVVRAQNDTSKIANITDTIFNRTLGI